MIKILMVLLDQAERLGIRKEDLFNAREFLNHHEFWLCFDTVITQMYEYDIEIDEEFYQLIDKTAKMFRLQEDDYSFMRELIGSKK